MRLLYIFIFTFLLNTILSAQTITTTVIKPPALLRCNEVPAKLNNVVFGAIPPNSADKPVLLFVHGWFDNGYSWFMADNKWYDEAYNAGYRTAYTFQSFSDAFQDNGKVIAEMIRKTCQHYNTKNVVAMCHSKGGLDMEWALYNENVWDSIAGVVTLSSPFYGAPLIDLLANPIIRLVTENIPLIGPIFKGKGTYQMQTANMVGVVRPMMDNNANNKPLKFHSFAAYGLDHRTVLPANIPDDILKIIFPSYNPLCINLPGFGAVLGDLMSAGMSITGNLTRLIAVQPQYNNPQKNTYLNDGLVPYYSAIRPGSVVISQPSPSLQSKLSHIDELFSWYAWDIVKPELEYFNNHPVYRTSKPIENNEIVEKTETFQPISNLQLIQTNELKIEDAKSNKLYVVGEYKNQNIKVLDENNLLVKMIDLNVDVKSIYSIFHEIDLSSLTPNKKYTLQSSVAITGFFQDGKSASIQLNTSSNKTYFADEALGFEVNLNDWTDNINTTTVKGFLNRNMNENGEVIYDKITPVTFVYDDVKQAFICNDKLALESGVYNLSINVDGGNLKRFATTSILLKQNKNESQPNKLNVSIYPNPVKDVINVDFTTTSSANYSVEIFDIVGKKLLNKNLGNLNEGKQQIQLSTKEYNLASGSYLLSISQNSERKSSKVFVVN